MRRNLERKIEEHEKEREEDIRGRPFRYTARHGIRSKERHTEIEEIKAQKQKMDGIIKVKKKSWLEISHVEVRHK